MTVSLYLGLIHGARGDTERAREKFTIPLSAVRSARRIMREGHGGCPRLTPRRCTDAAPHREQGHPRWPYTGGETTQSLQYPCDAMSARRSSFRLPTMASLLGDTRRKLLL